MKPYEKRFRAKIVPINYNLKLNYLCKYKTKITFSLFFRLKIVLTTQIEKSRDLYDFRHIEFWYFYKSEIIKTFDEPRIKFSSVFELPRVFVHIKPNKNYEYRVDANIYALLFKSNQYKFPWSKINK